MMFMQFRIGFDMGLILIKAICFSLLSVFTLMPGLLILFSKAMEKTPAQKFCPLHRTLGALCGKSPLCQHPNLCRLPNPGILDVKSVSLRLRV